MVTLKLRYDIFVFPIGQHCNHYTLKRCTKKMLVAIYTFLFPTLSLTEAALMVAGPYPRVAPRTHDLPGFRSIWKRQIDGKPMTRKCQASSSRGYFRSFTPLTTNSAVAVFIFIPQRLFSLTGLPLTLSVCCTVFHPDSTWQHSVVARLHPVPRIKKGFKQ